MQSFQICLFVYFSMWLYVQTYITKQYLQVIDRAIERYYRTLKLTGFHLGLYLCSIILHIEIT
jgi:hypothetical protein